MAIWQWDAVTLRDRLRRKEVSAREVVEALIARREAVDGRIHALLTPLDDLALADADRLDAAAAVGQWQGPLHGVPLTIKDNIDVAGTDSTMGIAARRGRPAASDAVVVAGLRQAGAIVLGKTNVPQLLLAQETENSFHPITRNPWHVGRSPGGSSGGEAAALASGQTPLGVGTDIGGSIRIPAHFCGVAGLKPTLDRWSNRGSQGAIPGQELVRAQIGPLARTSRDLALLFGTLDPLAMARLDPAVAPLPIGDPQSIDLAGLRVGVMESDGFLPPAASIVRAVRSAADALRAAGATIVPYVPPGADDLLFVWLAGISSDGGRTLQAALEGEAPCRQIAPSMRIVRLPGPVRALLTTVFNVRGDKKMARLLGALGEKPVADLWKLTAERTRLRRAEFDAWNEAGLDLVLCPPHTLPAMPLGTSGDLTLTLSYPFRYVMLNFPAGVQPVTRVAVDETQRPTAKDHASKRCAEVEAESAGLPVGVQVVARPWREDLVLAAMCAIEDGVRSHPSYPHTPIDPTGTEGT
ncbi:MAG: amidase [Myxococcales bacterium]|nr:amidase [Myxococcales bacterium]